MEEMEYELIEAVFEAKHSLHRVIHFANVPRGTFAAMFLIDQMNREPQQERAVPGVTVSMLSERLHNSRPAVTRLINDLEEQGYVVKLTAKQDRRFVYLMLTPDGQAVLSEAKRTFFTAVHQMTQLLGEEDSRELLRLLRRISALRPQRKGSDAETHEKTDEIR